MTNVCAITQQTQPAMDSASCRSPIDSPTRPTLVCWHMSSMMLYGFVYWVLPCYLVMYSRSLLFLLLPCLYQCVSLWSSFCLTCLFLTFIYVFIMFNPNPCSHRRSIASCQDVIIYKNLLGKIKVEDDDDDDSVFFLELPPQNHV